ncbi:efflux RND transporter periplasmic adaptor subunit [Xanthocytophaga flava]|uniref:efflux RND transporter periplasmic adaptor subunit n=1 Tax=Xanthocytophaga flava TaxID=3048013 RepID=UPI0028D03681|nr:efflux RND transporter periplasmic adaptor subunit [Xanthocytophaga flavus]MDJ1473038.1 efflux RND transporter periplasmic adaptor subunit [Xanthocytophaga flavus]
MKYIPLVLVLASAILTGACSSHEEEADGNKEASSVAEVQEITIVPVQQLQPSKQIVLPGELKPWNKVNIHPKVKGFVKSLAVDRGSVVKKGQVLAILDAPESLSELSQAKAQLQAAEATASEQSTRAQASKLTYQRMLKTSKMEGAVSLNELDLAKARMMGDSASATVAQGNVQAARAYYQTKSQLAQYLTITAPFDGVIIERNTSPGALVGPSESSSAKPLFVLEDSRTLRLTVAIPEVYANQISGKGTVNFTVNAVPEKLFTANYARSGSSLQEENRSMMTEFDIKNTNDELKAGMYAEVRLPITRSAQTLFVPVKSVVSSSEKVFVIRVKDDKAERIAIKKGNVVDTLVEVFGNLQPGDWIVKEASDEIREGQSAKWHRTESKPVSTTSYQK